MRGLPGDPWLNHVYKMDLDDKGIRGFAFTRIGAALGSSEVPGGPWADHRFSAHFTGDTLATWEMLSFESFISIREGNIGIAYITHDIGSFHGGHIADDMYLRWVQLGAFQPIFRFHSDHADRLPWQYGTRLPAESILRLRHSLIPYTYTIAHEASTTGLPMMRGLYLYYPETPEAYSFDREYFWGDQLIVHPVAIAGASVTIPVWIPNGSWTHWFTGEVFTGPATRQIVSNYTDMPVFAKAGAIIPMQPYMDYVGQIPVDPLILRVFTGDSGSFTLYEDEGDNFNYQRSMFTTVTISFSDRALLISARKGNFAGSLSQRSYAVAFVNTANPSTVTVGATSLVRVNPGTNEGFWYDNGTRTLNVYVLSRPVTSDVKISYM